MTTSSPPRAFQPYNNHKARTSLTIQNSTPLSSINETTVLDRIPYSKNRPSVGTVPLLTDGIVKSTPLSQKRRSSVISLSNLLPRRKSLQTTALATRRQSLWMNIAKTPPATNDVQPSILPLPPQQSNLLRKKLLRLLLVFSYLLSISLFAIALATFYGFFWSGYTQSNPSNLLHMKTSIRSLISLTTNSTYLHSQSEIEDE